MEHFPKDKTCECGTRGPRGYQGPPGPRGEQGHHGPKGEQGPSGKQGLPGPRGEQGPAGITDFSYGFAYTESVSFASGDVKFIIAGPMQNIALLPEGLKVSKAGIYQINYKAILDSKAITSIPSRFQVTINNAIKVASSLTESTTSTTLTSSNLFSLLEGDIVKLTAELQEDCSYKLATLQITQVG